MAKEGNTFKDSMKMEKASDLSSEQLIQTPSRPVGVLGLFLEQGHKHSLSCSSQLLSNSKGVLLCSVDPQGALLNSEKLRVDTGAQV